MHGLFEGARTIKSGQELPHELFEGAIFSRARSDQGNTVRTCMGVQSTMKYSKQHASHGMNLILSCLSLVHILFVHNLITQHDFCIMLMELLYHQFIFIRNFPMRSQYVYVAEKTMDQSWVPVSLLRKLQETCGCILLNSGDAPAFLSESQQSQRNTQLASLRIASNPGRRTTRPGNTWIRMRQPSSGFLGIRISS